ncbi:peptidyl-prolyl cis-trans isomerase [Fulvivirgaceae bacterium BMA12]|uniref:Peptidyl-prolyl cis-trans isomerase n=1 Tax=Agaribacillus aureus TaxID=3051825 RepID=A0ABT8LFJ4_9BACT|nr:peptidyl-prolyl cis-trans isomerase [Fulvivirgaceae bacterium BMA12]
MKRLLKSLEKFSFYLIVLICFSFVGCEWLKFKQDPELPSATEKPIARIYNKFLYPKDLEGVIDKNMSYQDSTKRANNYIKNWFKKQLIIAKAENELSLDQTEIERKILDYRYAIIAHEFKKEYVNNHLDTTITADEITRYYESEMDNFILKQNIFKGAFVKLPLKTPKMGRFRKLFRSQKPEDKEELRSYCVQFALNFSLEEDQWLNFDEVIVNTPLMTIPNIVQFLRYNKNYESRDESGIYFLKINSYKISDEVSPVEFVTDQIRNIILHKRKVELINKLEDDIYTKADESNEIEIFD